MQTIFARIHKGLALFISLGVLAQMLLAGIWHAGVVNTPDAHVFFGLALLAASLLALITAAVARLPRPVILRTGLLFLLILAQPILIEQRRAGLPILSSLHTLNAAFIGMMAGMVAAMAGGQTKAHGDMELTDRAITAPAGD